MKALERPTTRFAASAFAPRPAERRGLARDAVRLLVARAGGADGDAMDHAVFRDLPDHLRAGDVLVVNNSATVPAELDGRLVRAHAPDTAARHGATGEQVVVHLGARLEDGTRVVELRSAPDAARAVLDAVPGDRVRLEGPRTVLRLLDPWPTGTPSSPTGAGNRWWRAAALPGLDRLLRLRGRPIAYGYLDRRYPLADYQTVFATRPGSVEMASAGRPFTPELVTRLVSRGVALAPVTLHTGLSSQEAGEAPGPEWFEVGEATARQVRAAQAGGGRVVAVGTTATRALESAVEDGRLVAASGWTTRVVTPAEPPRVVTGLVTGWHDPHASHLLLVEAVAGAELAQAAYDQAVGHDYLWHEFGDSALLLPDLAAAGRW